jgi:putative DNA primase/helicase
LPEPVDGELVERLRGFVGGASDDEFKLIVSWLVATLRPGVPFPNLIVNGPQGSGKSILCKLLRRLVDPDVVPISAPPSNERDFVLMAANTWIAAFDNLSEVKGFLPDALCRLSSGGGFRTRALHTNREETVFFVQRPVLLNGIPALTDAPDLAERAIVVNLSTIQPTQRRTESAFWAEFDAVRAPILGALLNAAARALRDFDIVEDGPWGRMADFEKWSVAAAPALGWTGEEFLSAYRRNQTFVLDETLEADNFTIAIRDHLAPRYPYPDGWRGTATELQAPLEELTPERLRKTKFWPKTPSQIGNSIKRAKPLLEQKGFAVETRRSGTRQILIVPPRTSAATAAAEGSV